MLDVQFIWAASYYLGIFRCEGKTIQIEAEESVIAIGFFKENVSCEQCGVKMESFESFESFGKSPFYINFIFCGFIFYILGVYSIYFLLKIKELFRL